MTTTNPKLSYRSWVFTTNNPASVDYPRGWTDECVFITWQLERSPSGTPHLQGYLVLKANPSNKNGRTISWMKRNLCAYTHWEERRGTHEQARDYANKDDTRVEGPWTIGMWTEEGQPFAGLKAAAGAKGGAVNASKILQIKRKLDDGVEEEQLYDEHFAEMLRYSKAFDRYRMVKRDKHRTWHTEALVLYGPPNTGKTTRAYKYARAKYGKSIYPLNINSGDSKVWWDGYNGEECVVIEEFHGGMPISYFNKLHDKHPFNVETKGSMVPFLAQEIIYTSNENPLFWWGKGTAPGEPSKIPLDVLNAAKRRMTGALGAVIEMKDEIVPPIGSIVRDKLQQFLLEETQLKQFQLESTSSPIDLTASDEDVDDKTPDGDITDDEEARIHREQANDAEEHLDEENGASSAPEWTRRVKRHVDVGQTSQDGNDEMASPPIRSSQRMFPEPVNKAQRMTVLMPQPQLPGRFVKPRQAGTKTQTTIAFQEAN